MLKLKTIKAQNPSLMTEWKDVNNLFIDADSILENCSQNVWWILKTTKLSTKYFWGYLILS